MTIAEVGKKYGLTADTLRYYEKVGLIPSVNRTDGGIRNYTGQDCRWVEFIKCMRGAGLEIDVLAEYVRLFQLGDSTHKRRKEMLIKQREQLILKMNDLQKSLDWLSLKIEHYDDIMVEAEKKLKK